MDRKYLLYCSYCNWKKITTATGVKELYELPVAPLQRGIPKRDSETGKMTPIESLKQKRKFRCEGCGRAVTAKPIDDIQTKLDEQLEVEKREKELKQHEEDWLNRSEAGVEGQSIQDELARLDERRGK